MVIVVTGGIGSGKSEVCRILSDSYGFAVYEADRKAKELYVRYPELLNAIENALGCSFRDSSGVFQPSLMAARIFGDDEAISKVESLLFPYLIKDFKVFAETSGNIIIFESATVLEKTQFVDAPFELRLERACMRDGAGHDAVLARMNGQKLMNALSSGLSDERIDEIIINNGSVDDLEVAVKGVMDRFGLADIKNN